MKRTGKKYRRTKKKTSYISKGTGTKIINTGQGSIAKKRTRKPMYGKQNLEKETRKLVIKANARLDSLQRRFGKGTWASKTLMNKLDQKTLKLWDKKAGKIKMNKNMTSTQLTALNKATSNFLRSKTSSRSGIEDIRRKQIEKIKQRKKLEEDIDLSYEEAESLYEMFGNDDFQTLAEKIPSSALQACIEDAIEENDSEDDFIKRLELYSGVSMNDLDLREAAKRIYEKYVM